ncbi:MAG: LexA family transcriptional regulator [Peptococcaceae bacterium]|nr:LexA family transcriptional regulator [Peptococcaceae bacterium]
MKTRMEKHIDLAARRLREIREGAGMSQKDFAEKFGVHKSTYSRYESGEIEQLKMPLVSKICNEYNINVGWLVGLEEEKYILTEKAFQETKRLPILGIVKPNVSIFAQSDIIDYAFVPKTDSADFCLIAQDGTMLGAGISEGTVAYVKTQDTAAAGDIVVVEFDDEVIIRRLVILSDGTEVFCKEEIGGRRDNFGHILGRIIGKVTSFRSEVK